MIPSLEAHRFLRASLEACSWKSGWRSLLLRQYLDSPSEAEFTTAATPDHLFALAPTAYRKTPTTQQRP